MARDCLWYQPRLARHRLSVSKNKPSAASLLSSHRASPGLNRTTSGYTDNNLNNGARLPRFLSRFIHHDHQRVVYRWRVSQNTKLTFTISSSAPSTIWKSFRMNPDGCVSGPFTSLLRLEGKHSSGTGLPESLIVKHW